jgi:hypothetical protein
MDVTRHRQVNTLKVYDRRAKAFKQHAGEAFLWEEESAVDPGIIMVLIGGMGAVAQGLAAWWWFQASGHEVPEDIELDHFIRELREIGRLNSRAAAAQFIAANCAVVLWLTGAYVFQS